MIEKPSSPSTVRVRQVQDIQDAMIDMASSCCQMRSANQVRLDEGYHCLFSPMDYLYKSTVHQSWEKVKMVACLLA